MIVKALKVIGATIGIVAVMAVAVMLGAGNPGPCPMVIGHPDCEP